MDVWYAAYGSNLLQERFLTYLRGGPVPGSGRIQHGARDASDPADSRPYRLDRTMLFGGEAKSWDGRGVCFVDPHRIVPGDTLGRAWLLTAEQLTDVWAQENGSTVGPELDLETLVVDRSADLGSGWYRRLEYLGQLDGLPVTTITCETAPTRNAPGMAYAAIVGRGIVETWGLSAKEATDYLVSRIEPDDIDAVELVTAIGG